MSERSREMWATGVCGSVEWREAMSAFQKARLDPTTPEGRARREAHAARVKAAWERGVFDGVFVSPSSLEVEVAEALSALGIEYVAQFRPEGYSRVYDFLLPPATMIEVNGDYWHSLPGVPERDAEKAAWAQCNGYRLIVLTESAIHSRGGLALVRERVKRGDEIEHVTLQPKRPG